MTPWRAAVAVRKAANTSPSGTTLTASFSKCGSDFKPDSVSYLQRTRSWPTYRKEKGIGGVRTRSAGWRASPTHPADVGGGAKCAPYIESVR